MANILAMKVEHAWLGAERAERKAKKLTKEIKKLTAELEELTAILYREVREERNGESNG